VDWLVGKGVDPAGVCEQGSGRGALHFVASHGTRDTLNRFLDSGRVPAKVRLLDGKGFGSGAPGRQALCRQWERRCRGSEWGVCVGARQAVEERDMLGYTPLTVAILAKNFEVADALIKRGALARPALQASHTTIVLVGEVRLAYTSSAAGVQAGTWGWVLATVKRQERPKK
jgi:hypothetical protein